MKTTARDILKDIGSQLAYHKSVGIEKYPANEGTFALLNHQPQEGTLRKVKAAVSVDTPLARRAAKSEVKKDDSPLDTVPSGSLQELGNEIAACTACALAEFRILPVAGNGGERARLLIVGDRLPADKGTRLPQTCVFGIEQDRMLARMLDAIKLPRSDVFVTNVIKCAVPLARQPQAEHVNACYSYLQKQVAVLRPEMILAMGMIPARMMLSRSDSLSRLRGRFHSYKCTDGRKIPLVATYHPTFLMQNEGMKRATWEDLKLVARQLNLA
ncbi:uracil-DNA glycosylase [Desulfopila sp. IMCC35008]|uniref:uracil-DNA glycosylase n=1 Tax=Desulfopila sp. IMCC35008 TaxID=2653858 RepID=UPI0013D8A4F1|nr:uracil-DNA glycosylase [Desulfopila sp. IMCC35008]